MNNSSSTIGNRIAGALLFLGGIPFTIWLIWLTRNDTSIDIHFVMIGPMVFVFGLALAIYGKTDLRDSHGQPSRLRMMSVMVPVMLAVMATLHIARERDFPPLENVIAHYTNTPKPAPAAPAEHVVTREEVDAAIKEVNERAAELQKVRASLNTADTEAVKKFNLDAATYAERNHAVAALQAKYAAAQAAK
ncbi:MAG TPA: hypothetical protein VGM54_17480 [Chthoniobacter sp.]|jgi:hypothetical protein